MSELVDVLEKCIELATEEEYLIDKVIMSEKCADAYVDELQEFLNNFLCKIKKEFPDTDNFRYRRLIFPYEINPDGPRMIVYNGELWEVMKSSEYEPRGYLNFLNEVFLKREK